MNFLFSNSCAQQLKVGGTAGAGFIVAHSSENTHLAKSHPLYFDINLQNQSTGKRDWQHIYNMPTINHNISLINYRNDILGSTYAYTIQFGYPLIQSRGFRFISNIGIGVGVSTKPFDRKTNYKNNVIGSRITGSLHGKFMVYQRLTKQLDINGGMAIIHFSNGAFKVPNWGINVPYTFIGLNYNINNEEIKNRESIKLKTDDKWQFTIQAATGWKDVYPSGGKKNWYNTFLARTFWRINKIYRLSTGPDVFIDRSVNEFRKNNGLSVDHSKALKIGWSVGQELRIGQVSAGIDYGRYLYQSYYSTYADAYQRYLVKYHINENVYGCLAMKLHLGAADVIEFSMGYEF